ncbi:hypothetical protein SKAU_G00072060 [Synaphobranchus kaupii]|uniref:Uncharacterized protein n=1 Tax=Synaphobranchus kaupii TaxID=118154 RepID=A0A9Q1G7X6_SYNKA|nr:hypothetical protein SKAU_G00072060 [Synaphobranchus kaupii]
MRSTTDCGRSPGLQGQSALITHSEQERLQRGERRVLDTADYKSRLPTQQIVVSPLPTIRNLIHSIAGSGTTTAYLLLLPYDSALLLGQNEATLRTSCGDK